MAYYLENISKPIKKGITIGYKNKRPKEEDIYCIYCGVNLNSGNLKSLTACSDVLSL